MLRPSLLGLALLLGGTRAAQNWADVLDAGNACPDNKPSASCAEGELEQRWYWDSGWFRCLATTAPSCDESPALFRSKGDCDLLCRPLDGPTCAGPDPGAVSESSCFEPGAECPAGTVCASGMFFSCCPAKAEADSDASFSMTCADGSVAAPDENLVGLSCSDLVCPAGFACSQDPDTQFFARCCASGGVEGDTDIGFPGFVLDEPAAPEEELLDALLGGGLTGDALVGGALVDDAPLEPMESVAPAGPEETAEEMAPAKAVYGAEAVPAAPPPARKFRGRAASLKRREKSVRKLRLKRLLAPFEQNCRDKNELCPFWASEFKGKVVQRSNGVLFRLPQDHCKWSAFLRSPQGCPLSCGTCTNRRRKVILKVRRRGRKGRKSRVNRTAKRSRKQRRSLRGRKAKAARRARRGRKMSRTLRRGRKVSRKTKRKQ